MAGCGSAGSTSYDLGSGTGGTGLTSSFDSPAEMGVGDIMPIEFPSMGDVIVDFEGVEQQAKFVLVVGNAREGGVGSSIELSMDVSEPEEMGPAASMDADLVGDDEMTPDEVIGTWMRALEYDFALNEPVPEAVRAGKGMAMAKALTNGSTRTFRMMNSLSSATSYINVQGEVRCVGENVIIYVDTQVGDEMSAADVQEVCSNFDIDLGDELNLLGDLSDIDGNGKLIVFMSAQVNKLGGMGGGIITGYFYPGDLYGGGDMSNNAEIVYTMVPDPEGKWGVTVSKEFTLGNLIPAVLVHEAQHAISYNQHVFVKGGNPEDPWLNEAMSHFIEDYMGLGRENPSRVKMFLDNTALAGLVSSSTPNLIERGASYLFLRYLYEQHPDGDAFLRALMNTSLTGVENIEQAFGGSGDFMGFKQFMARWAVALAVTDRGITTDARYVYEQRAIDPETGNWKGVCLVCDAEDGRGTVLDGVKMSTFYGYHTAQVDSSALKHYLMETVPEQIRLEGANDNGDFAVLIRAE